MRLCSNDVSSQCFPTRNKIKGQPGNQVSILPGLNEIDGQLNENSAESRKGRKIFKA